MTLREYIASDAVQISLNSVFAQMMSDYGWTNIIDLQNFYNKYIDLVIAGTLNEVNFNQTSGYYQDIINGYTAQSNLTSSNNWIINFIDISVAKFDVPQNLMSPQTFYNTTVNPQLDKTNILSEALSMTGSQLTSGVG